MRALVASLLLASLLAMPSTEAQGSAPPAGGTRIADDAVADHDVYVAGQGAADSRWTGTDLLSLDASESDVAYEWALAVQALGGEDTQFDSIGYDINFMANGATYFVSINYDAEERTATSGLYEAGGDFGFGTHIGELAVEVDLAAATFTVRMPHQLLAGADGAPLVKGDAITDFWVHAEAFMASILTLETTGNVRAYDRMPDADVAEAVWPVQHGSPQSGTLRAVSKAPVRISNGEATTFLYEIDLTNKADHSDVAVATSAGAPENWVVTFPQEEIRLDAGAAATIPVLVTTPFGHDHGDFVAFNVTFQSRSDPLSYAVVDLGVRYTLVPQPAGHHDTVYLHTAGTRLYINTLPDPEIPAEEPQGDSFQSGCSSSSGTSSAMTEMVPLVPGLDLGLDVDMAKVGHARITLASQVPVVEGYSVAGFFLAWYGADRPSPCVTEPNEMTFAVIERSAPISIEAQGQVTVELNITPMPYGDYLRYAPDISMALVLVLYEEGPAHVPICCLGLEAPTYVEGSEFRLPLEEYHDPVNEYFTTLSGVDITSITPQQRLVNPGETVVFQVEVENFGGVGASYDLELTGSNLEWARILGDTRISLSGGSVRQLAVAVSPPADATDGDLADVTLHAVKTDDPNVRSLIRFLAEVDDDEDHPDDATTADDLDSSLRSKGSPGIGAAWLALAMATLAMARRRRND